MALIGSIMLFFLVFSSSPSPYRVEGRIISKEEDLELQRQLKSLNKPAIKTIKSEGAIFDCIDINNQPARDHPLLKNHKIQTEPTFLPKGLRDGASSSFGERPKAMLNSVDCPQGTVPIRRTRKEDLIRAKSFLATSIHPQTTDFPGQHLAILRLASHGNKTYYGVDGTVSVYNVTVAPDQSTSSQVWIENGPRDQLNSLQAGWMVAPQLLGDNRTRVFAYWSVDGGKTGCFNALCSGFVQVDKDHPIGTELRPTSIYDGKQYTLDIIVFQDKVSGHWWLRLNGINMGYWPKLILPNLTKGALNVAWGGLVKGPPNGVSASMGNGHFPAFNFRRACFFCLIHVVDASNYLVNPNDSLMETYTDCPKGYNIYYFGYVHKLLGQAFLFGGPGGNCGV